MSISTFIYKTTPYIRTLPPTEILFDNIFLVSKKSNQDMNKSNPQEYLAIKHMIFKFRYDGRLCKVGNNLAS